MIPVLTTVQDDVLLVVAAAAPHPQLPGSGCKCYRLQGANDSQRFQQRQQSPLLSQPGGGGCGQQQHSGQAFLPKF